jgi:deoxycytidylate deaminase
MAKAELEIFKNQIYQECIELSKNSKSANIRFGSLLVVDEQIVGQGWNRLVDKSDIVRMGYANHAEVNAINDALKEDVDLAEGKIFVAGMFPDGSYYLPREKIYTCEKCPKKLVDFGVSEVNIPQSDNWYSMTVERAFETAKEYKASGMTRNELGRTIFES